MIVLAAVAGAGLYLSVAHPAHTLAALPWAVLLLCPLMHLFMHGVGAKLPTTYDTDMPVFRSALTDDEIQAVVAYIKSTWPDDVRRRQAAVTERAQ